MPAEPGLIIADRWGAEILRHTEDRPLPAARGSGVEFSRLRLDFSRSPGRLVVREGLVWGPAIGATVEGLIDFSREDVRMRGTFVPAYALNNMLARLPIVGSRYPLWQQASLDDGSYKGSRSGTYRATEESTVSASGSENGTYTNDRGAVNANTSFSEGSLASGKNSDLEQYDETRKLTNGETFDLNLEFERAGEKTVTVTVKDDVNDD